MEELFSFEKLTIYQVALGFSRKIYELTKDISKNNFSWSDQFRRASSSIVLNIAEGAGRHNKREKRNFYNISRGSVFECIPLIEIGLSLGTISQPLRTDFRNDCLSLAKMLTKLIQTTEAD